jgi:hypothetical protein
MQNQNQNTQVKIIFENRNTAETESRPDSFPKQDYYGVTRKTARQRQQSIIFHNYSLLKKKGYVS